MTALEFNYSITQASKTLKPFALKLTKDLDDAKDLLQDTMVKAFLNKDKFTDGTNLKAWLYTIMKNTFITNYQKMVKKKTFIDTTENLHYLNSSSFTINNFALNSFASEEINRAIDKVDDLFKVPFMMYFKGFKYHEIAEELAIPIGTVKNRIHIARKELKDMLSIYANLNVN
jgi:RNA polymerase sigma factor (sigma-70 family)